MRRHVPVFVVVAVTAVMGMVPASASAASAFSLLTGANGAGSFNNRLDCGAEGGAGDTWRYFWQDQLATDGAGVLAGRWNGDFEVHRGPVPNTAFVPDGDGRLAITVQGPGTRSGSAFFDTMGGGSCSNATLGLQSLDPNDATAQRVSGSLPIVATGGLGALRGLTGSGTIDFTMDLTAGADNPASIFTAADLDVLDPSISVASGTSRWDNTSAWLSKKLRVFVTIRNAAGAGDAFQVKVTGASGGGGQGFEGLPAGNATITHGSGAIIGFLMRNANPGQQYTVGVTVASKDGLLVSQPPVSGSVTFRAPLLP